MCGPFFIGETVDRVIVYPGQTPAETDILAGQKFTMTALAMLAQSVMGTGTVIDGLACTPGGGLTVQIGPGQILSLAAADASAYSSLGTDSSQMLKQGLILSPAALSCPAPGMAGQSINYLIEAQLQDIDSGSAVLQYYNSATGAPYNGPGGSGASQATVRSCACVLQVKAGTAAITGSQASPSPDGGWAPVAVVTVANGQTSIVTGNISVAPNAPYIPAKLPAIRQVSEPRLYFLGNL